MNICLPIKLLVVRCAPSIFNTDKDKNDCVLANEYYNDGVKFVTCTSEREEAGASRAVAVLTYPSAQTIVHGTFPFSS